MHFIASSTSVILRFHLVSLKSENLLLPTSHHGLFALSRTAFTGYFTVLGFFKFDRFIFLVYFLVIFRLIRAVDSAGYLSVFERT